MVRLPYCVIVGGLIGAIGGAAGGAIIGAVAGCIAVLRGAEIVTAVANGAIEGLLVGSPVGILSGGAGAGIAWRIGHSIPRGTKISLQVGAATSGIASFGTVLGSVTAPIFGVGVSAILGALFGLSALGRMLSLDIPSRKLPLQTKERGRGATSISVVARAVNWLRNYAVAFSKGAMLGALGGLIMGAGTAIAVLIGLGFYVGDPLEFIVTDFSHIIVGSTFGAVIGALVGAIVGTTLKAAGRSQRIKHTAHVAGAVVGAGTYFSLAIDGLFEFYGAPTGAMIATIVVLIYTIAYHKTESTWRKSSRGLKK